MFQWKFVSNNVSYDKLCEYVDKEYSSELGKCLTSGVGSPTRPVSCSRLVNPLIYSADLTYSDEA